jgi:hypothetical protein
MPTKVETPTEDGYVQDDTTGTVTVTIADVASFKIRAPRAGGYRRLDELQAASRATPEPAYGEEVPPETFEDRQALYLRAWEWWTTAYEIAGDGREDWPADDLPLWLNANLATRALEHWATFPTKALGPSLLERLAAQAAAQATRTNGTGGQ